MASATACVLAFGAMQAVGAQRSLRDPVCPEPGNWCALSNGGENNCNECCNLYGEDQLGGLCVSFDEEGPRGGPPSQGCLCY